MSKKPDFKPDGGDKWILGGDRETHWKPAGSPMVYSAGRKNPVAWPKDLEEAPNAMKAFLYVGFAVGDGARIWTMDVLIAVVRAFRTNAGRDPSASFVGQRGVYKSKKRGGAVVEEEGALVSVIPMDDETLKVFRDDMIALAENICRTLKQEEVIVEIQKNGATVTLMGVVP